MIKKTVFMVFEIYQLGVLKNKVNQISIINIDKNDSTIDQWNLFISKVEDAVGAENNGNALLVNIDVLD